jgi:two-component system, OmpR family, KDP operon response regulator KdpE
MQRFAMPIRVLVIDNPRAATQLATLLSTEYEVRAAHEAQSALSAIGAWRPTVVITALELPTIDGIELCRRVRLTSTIAIIVLSRDADARFEVAALDAGADDYIRAPFCGEQLRARIRVALRRRVEPPDLPTLDVGDFRVDFHGRRVRIQGQAVRLTPKEFDLLVFMARHPNRVLEHRTLLEAVWGRGSEDHSEYLRVFVGQLRKKIETDPGKPRYLLTEPWIGYRFNPTGSAEAASHRDRTEADIEAACGLQLISADGS